MILSKSGQFLFVHNPRTGGTTIERLLAKVGARRVTSLRDEFGIEKSLSVHAPIRDLQEQLDPGSFAAIHKFAFVRNPWDRLVSIFKFQHRDRIKASIELSTKGDVQELVAQEQQEVRLFREWLFAEHPELEFGGRPITRVPQTWWLSDDNGIVVDHIGKFENLKNELFELRNKLAVAESFNPINKSEKRFPWWNYFDQESFQWVAEHFSSDIENFEYQTSWMELQAAQQKVRDVRHAAAAV